MKSCLNILKKICDKKFTVMNKKMEYKGPASTKQLSVYFCPSTDDPIMCEKVDPTMVLKLHV